MFKVGDNVTFVKSVYLGDGRTIGCKGVIREIEEVCGQILYNIHPDTHHYDDEVWAFLADELEIVK